MSRTGASNNAVNELVTLIGEIAQKAASTGNAGGVSVGEIVDDNKIYVDGQTITRDDYIVLNDPGPASDKEFLFPEQVWGEQVFLWHDGDGMYYLIGAGNISSGIVFGKVLDGTTIYAEGKQIPSSGYVVMQNPQQHSDQSFSFPSSVYGKTLILWREWTGKYYVLGKEWS